MVALWAVVVFNPWHTATAAGTITAVAIDADIQDSTVGLPNTTPNNTSTVVGAIDTCISVSTGDVFEIDVVMIGLPSGQKLAGAEYDIDYDGNVVQLGNDDDADGRYDEDTLAGDFGGDQDADGTDGEEGNDDPLGIGATIGHDPNFVLSGPTDFSKGNGWDTATWSDFMATFFKLSGFPTGPRDGVLNRVTVRAVGAGVSNLDMRDLFGTGGGSNSAPVLMDQTAAAYTIGNGSSGDAKIAVDQPCPLPTPTPVATPTPTPTPGPGAATVRIAPPVSIVAPGGNAAVSLMTDAPPQGLGAWTIDVHYDPAVLSVVSCTPHGGSSICSPQFSVVEIRVAGADVPGIFGTFDLADITFQAEGSSGQCSDLAPEVETFVDPDANPVNPAVFSGQLCIQGGGSPTPIPTGLPTPTPTPPPCPPPANDLISNASVIPGLPFSDSTDTTCATTSPDDPSCVGLGSHSVWYSFTSDKNQRIEANTFGSSYDTTLSVYTGSPGALTQIACNDQTNGNQSRVFFDATVGQKYFLMIPSWLSTPGGALVFSVDVAPPPLAIDVKIDPVGAVVAKTGDVSISGTVTCNKPAFVDLSGDLQQRAGRVIIQGYFSGFVACTGQTPWTAPWTATMAGENGIFKGGWAGVSVNAFAFMPGELASDQASASVQLRGSSPVSRECPRDGNFGFEAGLADTNAIPCWTVVDQAGGYGSWCNQTGTLPPQGPCAGNFTPVPAPPEGALAAMTNQSFVGSHLLYRCGVLRSGSLSFKLYINNVAGIFFSPPSLDYNTGSNQQFRADLVTAAGMAANPFTVAPSDVLLNLYQTKPGDPPVSGYAAVTANASAFVKKDVCLRFAVVDNLFYFHAGIDDVKIDLR